MGLFSKKEQKKIRETIELYVSAFNERDFKGIMSLIAPDDDLLYIEEDPINRIIGIDSFENYIRDYFSTYRKIEYSIEWMFFSFVDNMCWVNMESSYVKESKIQKTKYKKYVTFAMEKRRGDWFIVHVLNSINLDTYNISDAEIEEETPIQTTKKEKAIKETTEVYNFDLSSSEFEEEIEKEDEPKTEDNGIEQQDEEESIKSEEHKS